MIYQFNNCELNTDRHMVVLNGEQQKIEPQAFNVLVYLIAQRGRVVGKDEILDNVWGHEHVSESTLSSCIKLARRVVGDDGKRQEVIRTVHGKGYEFIASLDSHAHTNDIELLEDHSLTNLKSLAPGDSKLIGRQKTLQQLCTELYANKLITLVGPGGVGKTSIAYEMVRNVSERYHDGVYIFELVSITNADSLVEAIATTLSVNIHRQGNLEQAIAHSIQGRNILMVLDNCEHLIEKTAYLVSLLMRSSPELTILATSREPLAVASERLWPIEPLPVAGKPENQTTHTITDIPAVKLFVHRMEMADPNFFADEKSLSTISAICSKLDGIPLAIEIAASRAATIGVEELAHRIEAIFSLLKKTDRGGDARHQTLRGTVAWSYDLLDTDEQELFLRLAVFSGQFDLRAVEFVSEENWDAVDLLSRLVQRSMISVKPQEGGGVRYKILETMRAFGQEVIQPKMRLHAANKHCDYHIKLATDIESALHSKFENDHAHTGNQVFSDFRSAFEYLQGIQDSENAMRLVCSLREFAMRTMHYETLNWATTALELGNANTSSRYPLTMAIKAYALWIRGQFDQAIDVTSAAKELETKLDLDCFGLCERVWANVYFVKGKSAEGYAEIARQLQLAEESGDNSRLVHACYMHAVASSSMGDFNSAVELAQRADTYANLSGSPTDIASALIARGFAENLEFGTAMQCFSDSDRIAQSVGNRWMSTFARTELGRMLIEQDDLNQGTKILSDVIDIWFRAGEWSQQWLTLSTCVVAQYKIGDLNLASKTIGAVEANSALAALPISHSQRSQVLEISQSIEKQLGSEQFEDLIHKGARMPVTDIVHQNRAAMLA